MSKRNLLRIIKASIHELNGAFDRISENPSINIFRAIPALTAINSEYTKLNDSLNKIESAEFDEVNKSLENLKQKSNNIKEIFDSNSDFKTDDDFNELLNQYINNITSLQEIVEKRIDKQTENNISSGEQTSIFKLQPNNFDELEKLSENITKKIDEYEQNINNSLTKTKSENVSELDKFEIIRNALDSSIKSSEKLETMANELSKKSQALVDSIKESNKPDNEQEFFIRQLADNNNKTVKRYFLINGKLEEFPDHDNSIKERLLKLQKKKQRIIRSLKITGAVLTVGLSFLVELAVKSIKKKIQAKKAKGTMVEQVSNQRKNKKTHKSR